MLFLCRRGRQNLRELKKEDFSICTDSSGVRFVCKGRDELTKNRRENDEAQESQTVFEIGGPFCPVLSFEKYVSGLNPKKAKNEYLFQRPKKAVNESDEVWYDNMVVGQRTLRDKTKKLSIEVKLSCVYTNHSIRATTITILKSAATKPGIYPGTVWSPKRKQHPELCPSSLSTKRKMSETLSESLNNKKTVTTIAASSSVGHSEIPVAENTPEPLLTASQYILNDLSFEQSNTQQTIDNFYNCTFNF